MILHLLKNLIKSKKILLILCLLLLSMFSCTPIYKLLGMSYNIRVFIQADNELNNGGNPVVIRIYQLVTDVNFKSETPESFWRNDQAAFQKDVVGQGKEFILHPREVLKISKLEINTETVFLIVAADFYKPDKDQWCYLYDVTKNESGQVLIAVRGNTIAMTEVDY